MVALNPAEPQAAQDARPRLYAWYVAFVMMLAYVMSMVDRKFPFILVESIKKDLALTDTQVGLMTGLMFTLVYATVAIPIARLADRYSRKHIMAASLLVWSGLTAAGGFAHNFAQLASSRMGVAVGEAACTPAAHSMIGGYFPQKFRARALGLYFSGAYLGALIGLGAAGWLNDLANWRVAMMVLGVPGAILGLIVLLTVREPPRVTDAAAKTPLEAVPLRVSLRKILSDRPLLTLLLASATFGQTFGGVQAFAPAYLIRTFGLSTTEIGWSYGLSIGLSGIAGALLGGVIGDRFSGARWKALATICVSLAVGTLAIGGALLSKSYLSFLLFFFVSHVGMMIYAGPTIAFFQSRLEPRMHAMGSAVQQFAVSGLGISLGPLVAGVCSDHFKAAGVAEPLRMALLVLLIPGFIGSGFYLLAALQARAETRSS